MGGAEPEENPYVHALGQLSLRSMRFRTIARGIFGTVASHFRGGMMTGLEATLLVVATTFVLLLGVAYFVRA